VTRTYGGVGGEKPQGFPLSRFPEMPEIGPRRRGVLDAPPDAGHDSAGSLSNLSPNHRKTGWYQVLSLERAP
jgi:hypothetical protein